MHTTRLDPPTQQACGLQREGQAARGVQVQPGQRALRQGLVDQQRAERRAAAGVILRGGKGELADGWCKPPRTRRQAAVTGRQL